MALLYSYLFPTLFLVTFWVLYRHEPVPLVRHMGELLTVTALGGACFGLPTALVSERERGVLRRFQLAPVRTWSLIATTGIARYLLLLTAGLLQVTLAIVVFGMPAPQHPIHLLVAFTFVAFAFLGMGLVIAMTADNVPAVQALGQCIFLPMLIIGGIAVRIESLPTWAQHLATFFPGRYAVEALQVSIRGDGLQNAGFALLALFLIGAAACIAAAKLFRWEERRRFVDLDGKKWLGVALAAWIGVGALAQGTGRVAGGVAAPAGAEPLRTVLGIPLGEPGVFVEDAVAAIDTASAASAALPRAETDPVTETGSPPALPAGGRAAWQTITMEEIGSLNFSDLPPDEDIVAPVAHLDEPIDPEGVGQLQCMRTMLPHWVPGMAVDPVQRTRNFLYVAAVPDMFQMAEVERWVPLLVFEHLRSTIPEDDLMRILYWIAAHPDDGDDSASARLRSVCLDVGGPSDVETLRERTRFYALKLLGRMTGAIPDR